MTINETINVINLIKRYLDINTIIYKVDNSINPAVLSEHKKKHPLI